MVTVAALFCGFSQRCEVSLSGGKAADRGRRVRVENCGGNAFNDEVGVWVEVQ
jgi:hypothetical protein